MDITPEVMSVPLVASLPEMPKINESLTQLIHEFRASAGHSLKLLHKIFEEIGNSCYQIVYEDETGAEHIFYLTRRTRWHFEDFVLNRDEMDCKQAEYMKDFVIRPVNNLRVVEYVPVYSANGSYFGFINTSGIDLTRYQIYTEDDEINYEHCLLHSLRIQGVNVDRIRNFVINTYFPTTKFKDIVKELETNIDVFLFTANGKKYTNKYPKTNRYVTTIRIALFQDHYFVYERVENTWSLDLVSNLYDQGLFQPSARREPKEQRTEVSLSRCIVEQKPFKVKEKKSRQDFSISFADTECIIRPYHRAFLYGRYYTYKGKSDYRSFAEDTNGWEGMRDFLNSFTAKYNVVYFHNLKYDWNVIKNCPLIKIVSVMKKGGTYYRVVFMFYGKTFELRDSYKLIPKKLADFPQVFGITNEKKLGHIMYHLYTSENSFSNNRVEYKQYNGEEYSECYSVTEDGVSISYETPDQNYLLLDNRIAVHSDILKYCGNYFVDGYYYHISHCRSYIKHDCMLLYEGMQKYRDLMLEVLDINCYDEYTLPSMVHRRASLNGYYTGVYELTDNLRQFVSQSVQGGRVCTKDNAMLKCTGIIEPIDAKSMYPSSILEICNKGGFPVGPAKVFEKFDPNVYYYVVRVRILSVGKAQQLPFVSYLEDNGNRRYTNTLEDKVLVLDKITLEDWVKFQHIKYEFIEGIYWNQGGNPSMGGFMKYLYDVRQKNPEKNEICKLALSAVYGKTVVKAVDVKTVVKDNDKSSDYITNNFENLITSEQCANQTIFSVLETQIGHSNMAHIGGMILSMARRIMNEVIDVANDIGVYILYQDTDSLHVVDSISEYSNGLSKLCNAYRERYGKELLGNNLGQFGKDLKFPGRTGVHSSQCIFLGKKAYIHRVTDDKGEWFDMPKISGINTHAMSEYPDKWELYERMFNGETIPFNLAYGDGVVFSYSNVVITRDEYIKKVSYTADSKVILS